MEFKSWEEVSKKELGFRKSIKPENLCTFGVSVLDDCFQYILPRDLIVIGADSGMGKSDLAISIATHNAINKKKVAIFYLEGGHEEVIKRVTWKAICSEYYGNRELYGYIDMDYTGWCVNKCDPNILKIEEIVRTQLDAVFKDYFYIYDITPEYGVSKVDYNKIYQGLIDFFESENFGELKFNLDLLIIDHLHYFDEENRMTEIEKISKIMRQCKEICDIHKIPIILISHLRKKSKDRGLPDQEDFYGSSNIPKISRNSIVIAPARVTDEENMVYPTFFRVVKSDRGIKPNYAMLVNYDLKIQRYSDNYKFYSVGEHGQVGSKELEEFLKPHWYKAKKYKDLECQPSMCQDLNES